MKIAYFSNTIVPSTTANSIQIMKMCEAFVKIGCQVYLIAFKEKKMEYEELKNFYNLSVDFEIFAFSNVGSIKIARILNLLFHFIRFLQFNSKIDLIYTRSIQAAIISSILNFPYIFELHALPSTRLRQEAEKFVFKSRSLKRIVFISKALKEDYEIKYGLEKLKRKIMIAHDGADPINCNNFLVENLRLKGREKVLKAGYFGSFHPGKGLEIIVKMAPLLSDWDFHIFGGSNKELNLLQKEYNYTNLCWYGSIPPMYSRYYQCKMDVLLLPAQRSVKISGKTDIAQWMSPLKLFEYMSTGKPIVASNLPVIREVLTPSVNALLVDPENINMWIEALNRLKVDSALRQKIGTSAKKLFQKEYTWERRAQKVLEGVF